VRVSTLFALALVLLASGSGRAAAPPARKPGGIEGVSSQRLALEKLQGVWRTESLTAPSGEVAKDAIKGRSLVIEGNKFARKQDGKTFMTGRLALDASGKQKALVMICTDREGAEVWALYEIDGDTLKVCYDLLGKGRPTEFKAGATQSVAVYKRQKQ
jgi:uncharacterized protein (TIGR03067 family)